MGKNKTPFTMYKFRTMIHNADILKSNYNKLNELDGPLFKITNDPRHTNIGRLLAKLGIDELPQLINILQGNMSFVGPRPFPVGEAAKIPKKYDYRYSVLPGVIGLWVIKGFHALSFEQWMDLDCEYALKKSIWYDIKIFTKTLLLLVRASFKYD
jgi:lipopolysaccharide/colanic/teichoic acid biosynthesis glycosyltransferase